VIRSAADSSHRNRRVSFKSDIQESLKLLDTRLSFAWNVNNVTVQNLFFPLHDVISFQGHGKSQAQDFQLGVLECKVYHNVLLKTKSQVDLIVCFNYIC
jgi:hypothetical protein